MHKYFFLIIYLVSINLVSFSQLKIADFSKINIGTTYSNAASRKQIIDNFTNDDKEYDVWKGDFLNTYKITFENAPFDYYGNADYTFQYIKDTFSDIEIEYNFPEPMISQFERFIKQFTSDLDNNSEKYILFKTKSLNTLLLDSVINVARNECKENSSCNHRLLGKRVWLIVDTLSNNSRRIMLDVSLNTGELSIKDKNKFNVNKYLHYRNWMSVRIVLLDLKTLNLFFLKESLSLNYNGIQKYYDKKLISWDIDGKPITDEVSNKITLKEENGIYKIPVNINGILSIDFVLDLGASDISLSPDVFLVLYKTGTITPADFIGNESYQFADGTFVRSDVINLKSIIIGNKKIENVRASISKSINAPLLLGQSALKKLNSYKIDVDSKQLIIE